MTSSPRRDHEVAVVRQPIADARRNVVGYELLFGGQAAGAASGADVTSSLLLDAFGDIGIDQLVGAHPAWLAIAPEFLVEVGQPPLRPDRAVLQLPSAPPGDEVLAVLQQLARTGYTLALDHFDGAQGLSELLALCSIVKIDVADRDEDLVRALASFAAAFGGQLTAVGVDTDEDFQRCEALGFTYFQGSFLAKPRTVRQRGVATAGVGSLRALPTLASGTASFEELEGVIGADVGLSLKLLRYVNSAYFSLPRTVKSIREALQMLGARTVARWATVMALS
jgi:c-di-GMP phosphodiesterase